MSKVLHLQQNLPASASDVFRAITDNEALTTWFSEHASVSLDDNQYDFWGRFTPETPFRERGRHRIQLVEPNRRLRYTWRLRDVDTTVDVRLTERGDETVVGLWHHDIPGVSMGQPDCYSLDDLWNLWLENLRRYVNGRPVVRSDFSTSKRGDLGLTVDIDGEADAVWEALTTRRQLSRWIASEESSASEDPDVDGAWIDWGEGVGALNVLEMEPRRKLRLGWEIEEVATVVTWTIEESGGKTRLTLAHSGFTSDRHSDGEWAGWLNYLSSIKSVVEFGLDWLPPVKELTRDMALYYATTVWTRQDGLLDESDEGWE